MLDSLTPARRKRLLLFAAVLVPVVVLFLRVCSRPSLPHLSAVGPRMVSNQTSQPLALYGERLGAAKSVWVGNVQMPLTVLDEQHAYARLPAGYAIEAARPQAVVPVRLEPGDSSVDLTVVNDVAFADFASLALSRDGRTAWAASSTTDQLATIELGSGKVTMAQTGDGPSALATWIDPGGREWLLVGHAFQPELWLLSGGEQKSLRASAHVSGLQVDAQQGVVFVAEVKGDTVSAVRLSDGRELWRTPVFPNPRSMALVGDWLAVGSLQTGEVQLVERKTGALVRGLAPSPATSIVGGGTERWSSYTMGGKAPRAMAWSQRFSRLFLSSIGPNIGPNPDKMEVSMNGGVGVIDPTASGSNNGWIRHLGFGAGVTEALAVDDRASLLYASDVGLGVVRVLQLDKLVHADATARTAVVQSIPLPPPEEFPLVRDRADFGTGGRADISLHSGPKALALSTDGRTLYALNRFTGTLAVLDVAFAAQGKAKLVRQLAVAEVLAQKDRRLGQVLYYADLGRTAMTCDACHLEGHTEGVLFEKTTPLRIYRSTTVRGARDTPPYFTPASQRSLAETVAYVGGRNRFHNPDPTPAEVEALALFTGTVSLLPNPHVGPDGAPAEKLALPDGKVGNPRAGLKLFEGKAGCLECHPPPHFTTDQTPATRGRYLDVGTPKGLTLRPELQDLTFKGFAPPSLLGAWDIFPMLGTGAAGLEVRGNAVVVGTRFPLRAAVEGYAPRHGRADLLTEDEKNDLLAYVLSL